MNIHSSDGIETEAREVCLSGCVRDQSRGWMASSRDGQVLLCDLDGVKGAWRGGRGAISMCSLASAGGSLSF